MRSSLGTQAYSRGGTGKNKLCSVIQPINQSIKPATDKRVVYRADREKLLSTEFVAQSQLPNQQKQVHFGDTQLDMLTCWTWLPAKQALSILLIVRLCSGSKDADFAYPISQMGRDGDIWRGRNNALATMGQICEPGQDAPERLLRGELARVGEVRLAGICSALTSGRCCSVHAATARRP